MHLRNVPINYRTCFDTVKPVYTEFLVEDSTERQNNIIPISQRVHFV